MYFICLLIEKSDVGLLGIIRREECDVVPGAGSFLPFPVGVFVGVESGHLSCHPKDLRFVA